MMSGINNRSTDLYRPVQSRRHLCNELSYGTQLVGDYFNYMNY